MAIVQIRFEIMICDYLQQSFIMTSHVKYGVPSGDHNGYDEDGDDVTVTETETDRGAFGRNNVSFRGHDPDLELDDVTFMVDRSHHNVQDHEDIDDHCSDDHPLLAQHHNSHSLYLCYGITALTCDTKFFAMHCLLFMQSIPHTVCCCAH